MSDNIRLALMRQALALYDATDAEQGLRPMQPGEDIDPEIPEQLRNWLS
jgi:hypothetical protein